VGMTGERWFAFPKRYSTHPFPFLPYRGDAVVVAKHFTQGIHQGCLARTNGPANAHGKGALQVVPLQGFLPPLERAGRLERFVGVAMFTVAVGMAVRVALPTVGMVVMMVVVVLVTVLVLVLVVSVCLGRGWSLW
jgi:hypothetical protein